MRRGIGENSIASDEADDICKALHNRDALSVLHLLLKEPGKLLNFGRGQNESYINQETMFSALVSR